MPAIGYLIAEAVGSRLGVGTEFGGYIAGGTLLLLSLLSFSLSWWLVTRRTVPGYAFMAVGLAVAMLLAWGETWPWWMPAILTLFSLVVIAFKPRRGAVIEQQ